MTTGMTLTSFVERLDRWGANLERWPEADAVAGRALLDASPAAAAALIQAETLDQLLGAMPATSPPTGLRERILTATRPAPPAAALDRLLGWLQAALWRPLAISAMALLVGFVVGVLHPQPQGEVFADELALLAISDFEDLPYEN